MFILFLSVKLNVTLDTPSIPPVVPEAYIAEKGLAMINDENVVIEAVKAVLAESAGAVADYATGKEKAFGFLMGQVMRKLSGAGSPDVVRDVLRTRLLLK